MKPIIIVAGPSGAGKSSFVDKVIGEVSRLEDIITYTTRNMREGESEGNPYHFVSASKFEQLKSQNFFVEWAKVHTNYYGTPIDQIEAAWAQNKGVIMDVDVQGAATMRQKFDQAKTIFILPPSIEELRKRVLKRDKETVADLEVRMNNATLEIEQADKFDFQIKNDNFDSSYAKFKKIVEDILISG